MDFSSGWVFLATHFLIGQVGAATHISHGLRVDTLNEDVSLASHQGDGGLLQVAVFFIREVNRVEHVLVLILAGDWLEILIDEHGEQTVWPELPDVVVGLNLVVVGFGSHKEAEEPDEDKSGAEEGDREDEKDEKFDEEAPEEGNFLHPGQLDPVFDDAIHVSEVLSK